jgi:N-acetylglucosaminyldiphosphoundecaprenol N-acetyl-beta-D-mannosaminyltransferase
MRERYAVPVPPTRPWPRSRILNVWVDSLSMLELIAKLDRGIVFTLNPDHLYHLQRNKAFYDAYRQADFITSDSKYVYWALGWIGRRIKEKVSGSDIVPTFCWENRNDPEVKVFLLGAAEGIAETARHRINSRCGRNVVVGAFSPSMQFVSDRNEIDNVIGIINRSDANALIVGLGAPKQEIWITEYKDSMPGIRIFMGVGAAIDYEAGMVKRAPRWMTKRGLEWVYRITTEPKRYWRRYLRDIEFFLLIWVDKFGLYKSPMPDSDIAERRTR